MLAFVIIHIISYLCFRCFPIRLLARPTACPSASQCGPHGGLGLCELTLCRPGPDVQSTVLDPGSNPPPNCGSISWALCYMVGFPELCPFLAASSSMFHHVHPCCLVPCFSMMVPLSFHWFPRFVPMYMICSYFVCYVFSTCFFLICLIWITPSGSWTSST